MTSTRTPSGRREQRTGTPHLVLDRAFRAPVEDVWAAVTDPERLARWFGTWRGDPSTGRIEVAMTFDGMPFEPYVVEVCEPPHRLRVRSVNDAPDENWTLDLRLRASGAGTALELAQVVDDRTDAADVGPGWEYQLDRLEAAVHGSDDDVAAVTWGERYQGLSAHYGSLFDAPGAGTAARG